MSIKSFVKLTKKNPDEKMSSDGNRLESTPDGKDWMQVVALFPTNTYAWAPSLTRPGFGTLIYPPQKLDGKHYLPISWLIKHDQLHQQTIGACCKGLCKILYKIDGEEEEVPVWTGNSRYAECGLLVNLYRTPPGLTV